MEELSNTGDQTVRQLRRLRRTDLHGLDLLRPQLLRTIDGTTHGTQRNNLRGCWLLTPVAVISNQSNDVAADIHRLDGVLPTGGRETAGQPFGKTISVRPHQMRWQEMCKQALPMRNRLSERHINLTATVGDINGFNQLISRRIQRSWRGRDLGK